MALAKRSNTQLVEIFRGKTLNNSATTYFNTEIPVSAPVVRAWIRVNHALTIGTGTGAISEGELLIVKALNFRSDKGEYFLKNLPGRALYRMNNYSFGTAGQKDAVAAATGTYSVLFCLPFVDADPYAVRPYDTIFDAKRYKSVELAITYGSPTDLLTTPGTSTVAGTVDLYFEQLKTDLEPQAKPLFVKEMGNIQPVNPASQVFMDLERASDLAYTAFLLGTDNSATLGVPFSGTPTNGVVNDFTLETNLLFEVRTALSDVINRINKYNVAESTAPVGRFYLPIRANGSNKSALFSNEFSKLRWTWNNGTLSGSQISGAYWAIRSLK